METKLKTRKTAIGSIPEFPERQKVTISSKCPGKWVFVDMEDGSVWRWDSKGKEFRSVSIRDRIKVARFITKSFLEN